MLSHSQKLVKQGLETELPGLDNHRIRLRRRSMNLSVQLIGFLEIGVVLLLQEGSEPTFGGC